MFLFIDLGDYLFDSYLKKGELSKKDGIDAFIYAFKKLSEVPLSIISKVEGMIFMNSSGYLLEVRFGCGQEAVKLLKKNSKMAKFFSNTLNPEKNAHIFDLVTPSDHFALIEDLKQPVFQEMGFFFFDTLLTNSMARFLTRCRNVLGYRKIKKNNKITWEKIENIEKYLSIISTLHLKFLGSEAIRANYNENAENQRARFIKDLKNFHEYINYNIHVIRFDKNDTEGLRDFLYELNTEIGKFMTYYCKKQVKEIPKEQRLIIMDIEKLDEDDRREILRNISDDKYDNSIILIIVENKIDVRGFPKVNLRTEFSYADVKAINELSLKTINDRIKIFDKNIKDYKNVISNLSINEEEKTFMLKKIDDYSIGGNLFNVEAVNFWYDRVPMELKDSESIKKTIEEWGRILYGNEEFIHYQIDLDLDRDIWIVKKNNIQLKPIQFSGSKGMKYLVYLFKNYSNGKFINYQKLEAVADAWTKKGVKDDIEINEVRYGNISNNLYNLFKSEPELMPLKDLVVPNKKGPGCYFYKKDSIIIELGNFKIPDAM